MQDFFRQQYWWMFVLFFKSNRCTAPPKFLQTQLGMALLPTSAHVSLCFYVTKWLRVKASRRPRMAFSIKVNRAWAMEFPGRMQISHNKWLLVGGWTTPFRKKTCSFEFGSSPQIRGENSKNIWNHHLDTLGGDYVLRLVYGDHYNYNHNGLL